jgi:hypothetical protein
LIFVGELLAARAARLSNEFYKEKRRLHQFDPQPRDWAGREVAMKNEQKTNSFDVVMQGVQAMLPLRTSGAENWVTFWRKQDLILDSMETFAEGWFERRRDGTARALDAAQRSGSAESPVDAMRELQTWALGSFQRIAEDGLAWHQHMMRLVELAAPNFAGVTPVKSDATDKKQVEPVARQKAA